VNDKTEQKAFNIGTGVLCTLRDLAAIVRKLSPNAKIEIGPGVDVAEPARGPLDISRAKKELGYTPRFDLEVVVNDYIRTVRAQLNSDCQ
jgi:UDP-glucose 4-epimerase